MATGSDNDFAEVMEEMTLEKFEMWTVESLRTYLSLRNKNPEGNFETLVYRFVLFHHSTNFVLVYLAWMKEDIVYAKNIRSLIYTK